MPYSIVIAQPARVPEAFEMDDDGAVQSQAAALLYFGMLFKPPHLMTRYKRPRWDHENIPLEDLDLVGIPRRIVRQEVEVPPGYLLLTNTIQEIEKENALPPATMIPGGFGQPIDNKFIGGLQLKYATKFFETRGADTLFKLLAVSLHHRDELVRVSAAVSYLDAVDGSFIPRPEFHGDLDALVFVLVRGTISVEPLIRDVAATALARLLPEHPALKRLSKNPDENGESEPAHTSLIIHGTWARNDTWWQPGGDFHSYILQSVDPSVYSGADRFAWSGGYSDQARALGALDLAAWVQNKGLASPDFFAHSHGGSVVMLANRVMDAGRMVLLACPVHRYKYWPNFGHVNRVISVRVRLSCHSRRSGRPAIQSSPD